MSLHKSKGLSSPIVVIAGCVDGLLPAEPEQGDIDRAAPGASRGAASALLCGDYAREGGSELEPAGQPVADRKPDHDAGGRDAISDTARGENLWDRIPASKPVYP